MAPKVTRAVIVDSQPDGYQALCESSDKSLQLTILHSGYEAIPSMAGAPVQTWIINVTLSDMSGYELYEILHDRHPLSRFLLVSDHYNADEERRARQHGAGYLSKPAQFWWLEPLRPPSRADAR